MAGAQVGMSEALTTSFGETFLLTVDEPKIPKEKFHLLSPGYNIRRYLEALSYISSASQVVIDVGGNSICNIAVRIQFKTKLHSAFVRS